MAMDIVLDAIEEAHRRFPRDDTRHRIEHCHGPSREQVARIKRLGVIPVTQPGQINESGNELIEIYGEKRADRFCPLQDMLDEKIPFVVSTDAFVQSYKPFDAISAAVNRLSLTGKQIGEAQRISLLDAIRAYTWNAAYSVYHEKHKGSIEVGKLADLVVIDGDFLSVAADEIVNQQIWMTLSNGEIVYQQPSL